LFPIFCSINSHKHHCSSNTCSRVSGAGKWVI
jgi:hypothetical protein